MYIYKMPNQLSCIYEKRNCQKEYHISIEKNSRDFLYFIKVECTEIY